MVTNSKYSKVGHVMERLAELKDEYGNIPIRVQLAGLRTRPEIIGIRYCFEKNGENETIILVPRYDVRGIINEMSGVNSLVRQISDVQVLFVQYAKMMMETKAILESNRKRGMEISSVRNSFGKLYDIAKDIRDSIKTLQGFDKRLNEVIQEPIKDSDYTVTFEHHIDEDMTDTGFAALVTEGAGEKTSVQRLAVYKEIIKKINEEIAKRKRRIAALEKRIKAESGLQELNNAKSLKRKSEGIVDTLQKRREYVVGRFNVLKKSIMTTMEKFSEEVSELCIN